MTDESLEYAVFIPEPSYGFSYSHAGSEYLVRSVCKLFVLKYSFVPVDVHNYNQDPRGNWAYNDPRFREQRI